MTLDQRPALLPHSASTSAPSPRLVHAAQSSPGRPPFRFPFVRVPPRGARTPSCALSWSIILSAYCNYIHYTITPEGLSTCADQRSGTLRQIRCGFAVDSSDSSTRRFVGNVALRQAPDQACAAGGALLENVSRETSATRNDRDRAHDVGGDV